MLRVFSATMSNPCVKNWATRIGKLRILFDRNTLFPAIEVSVELMHEKGRISSLGIEYYWAYDDVLRCGIEILR